jgi:hypothetical protein
MEEQLILPDSNLGVKLGFTSDKFDGHLMLHPSLSMISLGAIISLNEHEGNVRDLLYKISNEGYSMDAVVVSERMRFILFHFGFEEIKKDYLVYLNPQDYDRETKVMLMQVLKSLN